MDDYGDVVVYRSADGTVRIDRADPVVGISAELLAEADPTLMGVDAGGNLVLPGGYVYRPVRFAQAGVRVLICELVSGP